MSEADLAAAGQRWPLFAPEAAGAGFAAVQALPMRLDMGQAFDVLRDRARAQNRRLAELATAVAEGSEDMASWPPSPRPS